MTWARRRLPVFNTRRPPITPSSGTASFSYVGRLLRGTYRPDCVIDACDSQYLVFSANRAAPLWHFMLGES